MTVNHLYPTTRPTLDLNFARQKRLDPRVTFTRGSTATYVGDDGLIKTAASNEARFDHDPATGESLGLLVEESRTNSLANQTFSDATYWEQLNVTTTATNAVNAPDGSTNAYLVTEDTANTSHRIETIPNVATTGNAWCWSIFAKPAGRNFVRLTLAAEPGSFAVFDITNGTVDSTGVTAEIQEYPNGWYRCTLKEPSAGNNREVNVYLQSDATTFSYTGDGTSGAYVWGAQLEVGTFPTSYIPTSGSTVTRSADVASMTGTNFSSWYNQSEGSLFAKWISPDTKNFTSPAVIKESTAKNGPRIYNHTYGGNQLLGRVKTSSDNVILLTTSSSPNTLLKTVIAYSASDAASAFNGNATLSLGITTAIPTMTRLDIGDVYAVNDRYTNQHIARLTYYPTRLTDSQLQELTR